MNWSWESTLSDNDTIRGTHAALFSTGVYVLNVTYAEDLAGNPLVPGPVPNPWNWSMTTVITNTVPADEKTDVGLYQDIIVNFSGPLDLGTVWWGIFPNPGGWVEVWGFEYPMLSHAVPFTPCTTYLVGVYKDGFLPGPFPSLVPNPWTFTTRYHPVMTETDPADGQVEVLPEQPINVTFSRPMNTTSVMWDIFPSIFIIPSWSENNTLLTLDHASLEGENMIATFWHLAEFEDATTYTMHITNAEDTWGEPLGPGVVPNPWSWMTEVVSPLPPPQSPPKNVTAYLSGPQLRDVTVSWQLSDDDFRGNVSNYDIHRGIDSYNSSGAGYSYFASVPSGVSSFVDQLVGQDMHSYYYCVCASNANGSSCAVNQAGKLVRSLDVGPQLVSAPLITVDKSVETVLQTVELDLAWHFSSFSQTWKWFMKSKPYEGQLQEIDNTMGVWVNVTASSGLVVAGRVPPRTNVMLLQGWNLVAYPSLGEDLTVGDLKAMTGALRVEGFSPAPPNFLEVLEDWETLSTGFGYWIKVPAATTWIVLNT
ncbi:MAG: Ig-like domain-containing protein [Thermoplasmata archaeon]